MQGENEESRCNVEKIREKINHDIKIENTKSQVNGTYSKTILIHKFPKKATPGFLYALAHGSHVGIDEKTLLKGKPEEWASKRVDVNLAWHFKEAEFDFTPLGRMLLTNKLKRVNAKIERQSNSKDIAEVVDPSLIETRNGLMDILRSDRPNDYLEVHYVMTFSSNDKKALDDSLNAFTRKLRDQQQGFKFRKLNRMQAVGLRAAWMLGNPSKLTKRYSGQIVNQDQLAAFYPYLDGSLTQPEKGVYIGHRSPNGTTVHIDFTIGSDGQNILVIGKTGKGKSFWIKGLMEGLREAGFKVYYSDPDGESKDKIERMGGKYIDLTTNNSIYVDPVIIQPALMPQIDKKAYSKAELKKIAECDAYRYQQAMDDTLSLVSTLCDESWGTGLSNATQFAFMQMYASEGVKEDDEGTWDLTQGNPEVKLRKLYDVINMHGKGQRLNEDYELRFMKESKALSDELWTYFEGGNRHMFTNPIDYDELSKYQTIGYKIATDLNDDSKPFVKKMARIRLSIISTINNRLIMRDRLLRTCFSAEIFDEFQRSGKEADTKAVAYRAMTTSRKYNSMAIIGLNDPTVLEDGIWSNASHKVLFYVEENLIQKTREKLKMSEELVSKWYNLKQYEFIYSQSDPVTNQDRSDILRMYLPEEENKLAATRGVEGENAA